MLTVIPFCPGDVEILVKSCLPSLLEMQDGNLRGHSLVLLPTMANDFGERHGEMKVLEGGLRGFDLFAVAQSMVLPENRNIACDLAFRKAYEIASGLSGWLDGNDTVFFCEPDVTFVREAPLDCLEEAFWEGATGVLGHLSQLKGLGIMSNGVAVYGLSAMGEIASRISSLAYRDKHEQPFDLACRATILENLTPTNLIGQLPATREVTHGEGYNFYYSPGFPVCWHGVKDGSLWEAVEKGKAEWEKAGPPDLPRAYPLVRDRDEKGKTV